MWEINAAETAGTTTTFPWEWLVLPLSILLGLLMMIKPEWLWKIENFLDVEGGKPTEWYLAKIRLMGAGLFLTGMVICVILFAAWIL